MNEIGLATRNRSEMIDITARVQEIVSGSGVADGLCVVYVPHTTAGVTINEGADPAVRRDIIAELNKLAPQDAGYSHQEGNSDGHIKATLTGPSVTLIVEGGRLLLGTWQAIYFCEYDGPRSRHIFVKLLEA